MEDLVANGQRAADALIEAEFVQMHEEAKNALKQKPPNQRLSAKSKPPNEEGGRIMVMQHMWHDVAATSCHVDVSHIMPHGRPPSKNA